MSGEMLWLMSRISEQKVASEDWVSNFSFFFLFCDRCCSDERKISEKIADFTYGRCFGQADGTPRFPLI